MSQELSGQTTDEASPQPRRRSLPWSKIITLALCVAGYFAANMFWQYLASGDWLQGVNLSLATYNQAVITPIGETFFHPLSVFTHPWMILVTGLVLGLIVFAPLIIAVTYRLSIGMAFTLLTAFVGHAPVLALAVALGCMFAARTRLRDSMPMAAITLGLLPAGLYLCLSSFANADSGTILPVQRWVPYAPFVVAMVAALAACAIVLTVQRFVKLRLAIIAPVLLAMLFGAVAFFYWRVGASELEYALIADRLATGCSIFEPTVLEVWARNNNCDKLSAGQLHQRILDDLAARRQELTVRCDSFVTRFSRSERCPAVLWIQAQCQSVQLDETAYKAGTVRYIESRPLPPSRSTWEAIRRDYAESPQALLADWRLGEMALRQADMTEASRCLAHAADGLQNLLDTQQQTPQEDKPQIFRPMQSVPTASYYEEAQQEVQKLLKAATSTGQATSKTVNP